MLFLNQFIVEDAYTFNAQLCTSLLKTGTYRKQSCGAIQSLDLYPFYMLSSSLKNILPPINDVPSLLLPADDTALSVAFLQMEQNWSQIVRSGAYYFVPGK
jgi:hypothetical protein